MESQDGSQPDLSQTTFSPISQALPSAPSMASTTTRQPESSSTTGKGGESQRQIGKPLSETVLGSLRSIAANVSKGLPLDQKALVTLLQQHFGSRLDIRALSKAVYGKDGGYDEEPNGYQITFDGLKPGEGKFLEALEFLNRPAKAEQIAVCFARLRTTMLRASESNADIEILLDTLTGLCREYPADAIISATNAWMQTKKFFPLPCEFLAMLNELVALRKSLFDALNSGCQAPKIDHKKPQTSLDAGPSWKDIPMSKWTEAHWQHHIGEARDMLRLAQQNPSALNVDHWKAEIDKREMAWAESKARIFAAG